MDKKLHTVDPRNEIEHLIETLGYIKLFPGPVTHHELVPLTIWLNLTHQIHPVVLTNAKGYFGAVIHADTARVDIMRTYFSTTQEALFHAVTRGLQAVEEKVKPKR